MTKNRETARALGNGGFVGADIYRSMTAGLRRTEPAYDAYDKGQALVRDRPSAALRLARQAIASEFGAAGVLACIVVRVGVWQLTGVG